MSCKISALDNKLAYEVCGCGHTFGMHMNDSGEVSCQICDMRDYVQEEVWIQMSQILNGLTTLDEARELIREKLADEV